MARRPMPQNPHQQLSRITIMKTQTIDKVKMRIQIKTALSMLDNEEFMALFKQWDEDDESQAREGALRHAKAALRTLTFFPTRVEAEKLSTADRQRSLGYKPRNPVLREVWASGVQCQNRRCVTPFAIGNIRYSKRPKPPSDAVSDTYVCVVTPFAIHLYIVNERHFPLLHVRNKVT